METITIEKTYTRKEAFERLVQIFPSGPGCTIMLYDTNTEVGKLADFLGIDKILK